MENLVVGLYFLALLSCCLCLWFWYELETAKQDMRRVHERLASMINRMRDLEQRRR